MLLIAEKREGAGGMIIEGGRCSSWQNGKVVCRDESPIFNFELFAVL